MIQVGKPITDYSYFDLSDQFILEEVPWLWNDLMNDPTGTQLENQNDLPPEVFAVGRYLTEALEKGLLKSDSFEQYRKERDEGKELAEKWLSIFVTRQDLIDFAKSQGKKPKFLFPEERENTEVKRLIELQSLNDVIERLKDENEILGKEAQSLQACSAPLYLDKDHPMYSKELEAAVSAWQALFSSGKDVKTGNKTSKRLIEEWLEMNRRGFSKEACERIQKISNPDRYKIGGAPKTE